MLNKPVTIYQIAEEAKVSIATVSRVLAKHPNVSKTTRARVQAIIDARHFYPSSTARSLDRGVSRALGIILPGMDNPYFCSIYMGAVQEAKKNDYSLVPQYLAANECIGPEGVSRLIEQRLDGVLFIGGPTAAPHEQLIFELTQLQRYMPVVALSPPLGDFTCTYLYNDLADAMRQVIRHLQALGHYRIAFLGGSDQIRNSGARGRAFLETMGAHNLWTDVRYHHEAGYTPEAGELAVLKLLSSLGQYAWPTALVAINDLVALGALRQLHRMKVRVPHDIAIVGCDNQFFSAFIDPPLTTIDLQPASHAQSAIDVLLDAQKNKAGAFTYIREAPLVVRESCGVKLGRRSFSN